MIHCVFVIGNCRNKFMSIKLERTRHSIMRTCATYVNEIQEHY